METANILLDVGSDGTSILVKSNVTPAEVAVLRVIHGSDAVTEIEVLPGEAMTPDGKKRTHRQEIARLMEVYGKPTPEGGREAPAVSRLFPGAAARVFEAFEELELDESQFKAATRSTAARPEPFAGKGDHDGDGKTGGTADSPEVGLRGLTIPQLRTMADEQNIDLEGATRKDDIIAKIEAGQGATADDGEGDDDGVGDMNDRSSSVFE